MLILISLIGLTAMALSVPMVFRERKRRHQLALARMHTRFKALHDEIPPVDLYASDIKIGRWRRRCEICLAALKNKDGKSPISKVHARLWWQDGSFHIAPVYTRRPNGTMSKPLVWVDMKVVPEGEGLEVKYGQVITLSNAYYKFKLEDTSAEYGYRVPPQPAPQESRLVSAASGFFRRMGQAFSGSGRKPRKKGTGVLRPVLLVLAALLVVAALVVGLFLGSAQMPESDVSLGQRKEDTATFLICGVDAEGLRTDTMMLVYVSGSEDRIGLLSLPRDTISISKKGNTVKLNGIYGGREEEGAEDLMDVVQRYIGYRPDGYVFFDWALVREMTDLMGGVDVSLDHFVDVDDGEGGQVYIPEGQQHLDGRETLAVVRYRKGYDNADLDRIKVQRKVIKACAEQWISLGKVGLLGDALELLQDRSITDLSNENLLWVALTAIGCKDSIESETLAGYAEYRNKVSYYILSPEKIAAQINEKFNPYTVDVTSDMLDTVP